MNRFKRVFAKLESILHALSSAAIFFMMLLIAFDTAGRYFLNKPIQGTYEITEMYLMVMVVFLTLSYTFKSGDHIRIDICYRRFRPKTKALIDVFGMLISAALFAVIAYQGGMSTLEAWSQNEYTFGVITLPMYLSYIWVPLGSGALTLRLIIDACKEVQKLMKMSNEAKTASRL
ncbi:TRAP transporter small permease subunit [Brevibacillus sp. B_LB10_24]|uniref:TRAP transporter small permease subunit n=1 Tax=Brevibacillus sp. B_LB10_24 TaxID=3380645 RepID=UPI0038BD0FB4